ncbi:MAG: hypothetical protein FRX49_07715 [Trebouxia sp. A1-2]|nr:MAG: hypothetical protein FRX49_07715 [Trebouxia sp. A1-2]
MSSVLAPSFLLELGAYAIAAAGIRLFKNRISRARQPEAQNHPEEVHQQTSTRVIGLSHASPLLSTCRRSSRSPQPCPDDEVQSRQAAGISCKDAAKGQSAVAQTADVVMPEAAAVLLQPQTTAAATQAAATPSDVHCPIIAPADTAFGHVTALSVTRLPGSPGNKFDNMGSDSISSHSLNRNLLVHGNASQDLDVMGNISDGGTSAQNNKGVPSSTAACHNRAASQALEAAAEGEQQQLQDIKSKAEQQDVSCKPDGAVAIGPEIVEITHRGVDTSPAGDCDWSTGPSPHPMSEDDPDVDIMTREQSPACDHMTVDNPSDGRNDDISGMDWALGLDTLGDDCDNIDQDRSLLLSAIQKHKHSAKPNTANSEMQLFASKNRTCGLLIGGAEEEMKQPAEPATGDAAVPADGKAGEAYAAQPNDLLREVASVTLRLLAGALRHSPASEAAQPDPSPSSQARADQPEHSLGSDFSNPAPSQAGQTLAEPGLEEEEGQLVEGSQSQSAGICVEGMPMLEEESEEAHPRNPTSSGQPSHFGSAYPDSLTEAEVCSQGSIGQPDQAMEHDAEEEDQDSIQECDETHDSHSDVAEAKEHGQAADATHQEAALSNARMATEDESDAPAAPIPSESLASHPLAHRVAASAVAMSLLRDSSSAAAISAPEASGAPAADTLFPANIAETTSAAPSVQFEEYERAELEESDELCPAVSAPGVHCAQRAEETEACGDEAPASRADKYQPGKGHHGAGYGSEWGIATQPTLDLPRPSCYATRCFSKSPEKPTENTRGGSAQPNFCHESDYLFLDSPDHLQPQSAQQHEQLQSRGLPNKLPNYLDEVCSPDVHQLQRGQLEKAYPALSDRFESRAVHAEHPAGDAQTDWGRELPMVDSAPPIAYNRPPASPASSSAWDSPDEAAVNSPAGILAHSYSPEWESAHGAFSNRPRYRAVPASPPAQSPAWGSPQRASCSRSLRHAAPINSPAWRSPDRAARDSLDCRSPVSPSSPAASPATLPHGDIHFHTDQPKPTKRFRSPEYVSFWNLPKLVSASAARAAHDSPDLKEADNRLSEPVMSPRYLPSGGGMEEEDQQIYAEPDHEEEDSRMAELQQGQVEEGDDAAANKYEGAYARPSDKGVFETARDYVHDAWDLSESSEEDEEDNVPATAAIEHEEEDDNFQVTGSFQPDSAEEDEGMHGTRAAAGSSPGQALSPGPDKMLSQDEEDCMLEEEDCTEKHLAAGHELEGLLDVDDINIDNDDDVQFIGETGPDPSKSAFQLARKRLASIRAGQRCGDEEDDVELYPGVQDLISGTLQSGGNTAHQVCDFGAELSKGSTILRHFKRLRRLPSTTGTGLLKQMSPRPMPLHRQTTAAREASVGVVLITIIIVTIIIIIVVMKGEEGVAGGQKLVQ